MNKRIFRNNDFSHEDNSVTVNVTEQSDKLKPVIKTVFIDTDGHVGTRSAVTGIVLLFFCILAGCAGLIFCLSDSFSLELNFLRVIFQIFSILTVFTVIYFFPSRLFTTVGFFVAAGLSAWYVFANLEEISKSVNYTVNYCLFKITQEGYVLPSIIDYGLAELADDNTGSYINTSVFILTALLTCIFSYIAYSKKSMWIALLVSLAVIFPGFFYGLIPTYFSFSIVIAFLVSVFAINIFESGSIAAFIDRDNKIPEKKLEKYKYRHFKKQYYKSVNDLKKEIKEIATSPNRDDNSLRLERLVRELQKISNNQDLFLRFYGLNKFYKPKKKSKIAGAAVKTGKAGQSKRDKQDKQKKEKFISPLKAEKLRIISEKQKAKEEAWAKYEQERLERRKMPLRSRIMLSFRTCFSNKVGHTAKSGYAGFCAFVIAIAAIILVQPFISPRAKFRANAPQQILDMLTNTVEYMLVGSNSGVYGGYGGGMGGGFLLSPGGANFENKPILRITGSREWTRTQSELSNYPTLQSGVLYLKGWYGNVYNGKMWLAADKNHIDEYELLKQESFGNLWNENNFFLYFTPYMQSIFGVTEPRRSSELTRDSVTIEHLVTGGRLVFMPYFFNGWIPLADFNIEKEADLNFSITKPLDLLFKYPKYGAMFFSVDNILNRADFATDDLREYIDFYENDYEKELEWVQNLSLYGTVPGISPDGAPDLSGNGSRQREMISDWINYYGSSIFPDDYYTRINTLRSMEEFYNAESAYYDFVMKYYLDIPDALPQEVKDLAKNLTEDAENSFDKALLIEDYLANNHEYTLHPRMPYDPGQDFVYNFLFDTQEGYCTYYATSMVIMLRSLGIPSRYVEGYLVDTRKRQRDEEGSVYITVYDTSAHAWPEVYFRGIGWIPFEPTTSIVETPEETRPYEYTPPARLPAAETPMEYTTEEWIEEEDISAAGNSNVDLAKLYFRAAILLIIILLIIAFNLGNYIINFRRLKYFKSAKTNDAVVKILSYTLKLLKYCGFVMHNDEGLIAFADRVSESLEIFSGVGFRNSAAIMQKSRYSRHEISEEERLYVYDFVVAVRKSALDRLKLNLKLKFKFVYFIL